MKQSLLIVVLMLCVSIFSYGQLDTVIGFTFPVNTGADSLNADFGISNNTSYDIRFETESTGTQGPITLTNGATTYAATATSWDNGKDDKYFSIKFKTTNYGNLVLYAKLRSGGNKPGPKYFKVQYKIGGSGTWEDVSSDTITIANDWTTGVVDGWVLPSQTWNASQSVHIRFISITNTNVDGNPVAADGIVKIDDIFILGSTTTSLSENGLTSVRFYPNPTNDILNIENNDIIAMLNIVSIDGRIVSQISRPGQNIDISSLAKGHYFLQMISDDNSVRVQNLVIE